jgi:hypothetical protein
VECAECPEPELLDPCSCINGTISSIECSGTTDYSLKHIFQNLSKTLSDREKHFHAFTLSNAATTQLPENLFENITFDRINLNSDSLIRINTHTFESINSYIRGFENLSPHLQNDPPNNDLFTALSSMNNLGFIIMNKANIPEIPSNAFNGTQHNLATIKFHNWNLTKIGDKVFSTLSKLSWISLRYNNLTHISAQAFDMRDKSSDILTIDLQNNQLNDTSFEIGAFLNTQRPTHLLLSENKNLTHLDEAVFKAFLSKDPKNEIKVDKFDCDNRKSLWIKPFLLQLRDFKCKI